jgi:hypothetical protein
MVSSIDTNACGDQLSTIAAAFNMYVRDLAGPGYNSRRLM